MAGRAYIGTSGWSYPSWKDEFYSEVPQKEWLKFCAERFTGIEVNATFYRLQEKTTFEKWRGQTPDDFHFAIKGNRFLTHNKKLNDPREPVGKERKRAAALGKKLAAVLWQMPPRFKKHIPRLEGFAGVLDTWRDVRHALEFRHASWFDNEVSECLRRHRLAVCLSDAADWPMWEEVTTNMVYVRLHGHTRTYASPYSTRSLKQWASRTCNWLNEDRDVHVYFDNDAEGAAPYDAMRLIELVNAHP